MNALAFNQHVRSPVYSGQSESDEVVPWIHSVSDMLHRKLEELNQLGDIRDDTAREDDFRSLIDIPPLVNFLTPVSQRSLHPSLEWEGYVVEIGDETFTAHLRNVGSASSEADEYAEFSISDVNSSQRHLLVEGAIFRWLIGTQRLLGGQRQRVSELFFRNLPVHRLAEFQREVARAEKVIAEIDWED